ncbi:RNA-binding protein [Streptomyces sp. NBC_00249]|uniref:RNA-binding protein n=1 Tax=Streptomyces sp. NBC_00249 TaxID=2975690 RepID=UPI00224D044A|nr:RNA-binding protein [Streptomyces sp. NBC_00249]MCX5195611.1 RNA-binding protein [Streptomyces sp. NBC_00249]
MRLPFVHRVTKYDPADRDEHGHYVGAEDTGCDHGPVEAAYLAAVGAFAAEAGVRELAVREPILPWRDSWREGDPAGEPPLPAGLAELYDGLVVPPATALELVRGMLRGDPGGYTLEAEGRFFVEVGWDQYVYVGSAVPGDVAVRRTAELGLFAERISGSAYERDRDEEPGEQCPADDGFWARLAQAVADGQAGLLEEGYVHNLTRWHRLTPSSLPAVRAGLAPRAMIGAWPAPTAGVGAVLAALSTEESVEVVWEDAEGRLCRTSADEEDFDRLRPALARARSALLLPAAADERRPLLSAVLPDADGVLRARWRTVPGSLD